MLAAAWIDSPWEAVVAVVAIAVVGWVIHGRPVKAAVGRVAVEVGQVKEAVEAIDHAVNQRPSGDPTMSTDVAEIRQSMDTVLTRLAAGDRRFDRMEDRLAAIEDAVTSPS